MYLLHKTDSTLRVCIRQRLYIHSFLPLLYTEHIHTQAGGRHIPSLKLSKTQREALPPTPDAAHTDSMYTQPAYDYRYYYCSSSAAVQAVMRVRSSSPVVAVCEQFSRRSGQAMQRKVDSQDPYYYCSISGFPENVQNIKFNVYQADYLRRQKRESASSTRSALTS